MDAGHESPASALHKAATEGSSDAEESPNVSPKAMQVYPTRPLVSSTKLAGPSLALCLLKPNPGMELMTRPRKSFSKLCIAQWKPFASDISTSNPLSSRQARILVCTWNLHGRLPSEEEAAKLLNPGLKHDLYVVGTQECQRSIAISMLLKSKVSWETLVGYGGGLKL